MAHVCTICEGSGLRLVERPDGTRVAQECVCRAERRAGRQIAAARIPERYQHCTLEDYEVRFNGADRSLSEALVMARNFVSGYPVETNGNGLLLMGSVGVGKTHLAVAILRELVQKGGKGLFWDYRDLTKTIQHSYNQSVSITERDVLRPVFEAEILVLDELGANKITDWEWDTVAHILNTRYNDRKTTIITTNYANAGAGCFPASVKTAQTKEGKNAQAAVREETLGDRIGDRMFSRLHEMCVVVEISGADFRKGVKRARFGVDEPRGRMVPRAERPLPQPADPQNAARPENAPPSDEPVGRERMGKYMARSQPPEYRDDEPGERRSR